MSEKIMQSDINSDHDDLCQEYHFDYSKASRGKYAKILREEHSNLVVLDPDVANVFKNSQSVNHALRSVLNLSHFLHELEAPSYSVMEKH